MPPEYGAFYPSEGDTGADAPAGYVTMWADFFGDCNLRLPLTVFVVEVLEWYKIHISQLSPLGMIRIRNFESTFRALGIEPSVGDFRRFYQMTISLGFFSFRQRDGSPKLMTPPRGMTKWKMKFFYIKAAAIVANMTFRNVTETIITETIAVPSLKTVEWFLRLQTIEWVKLSNTQLWVLRMMLTRRNKKLKPVVREKSGEDAPLWRMFASDFRGQVETVVCADGEEEFNVIIRDNFRVPTEAVLAVELPRGKGDLGALGDPDAKGVPKRQVVKGVRFRQKKIPEVTIVPHLVPQAAAAGGNAAGSQSVVGKRLVEETAAGAGGPKRRRLQSKRIGPTPKKPAVTVEPQDDDFSIFDAPLSPPHTRDVGAGAGVSKEPSTPFVKVVPDSTAQAEGTADKTATQIFDTVDSSNNLISPNEGDNMDLRFSDSGKQKADAEPRKTDAEPQKSSVGEKVTGSSVGGAGYDGPPIQPRESELEYYYRTYTQDRSTVYHRPPWTVMQGGDISNDPSACKEILSGLGTPFKVERAHAAPRELRINQLSTMLVGSSIMANAILEDYKVLSRREEEVVRLRAEAEELVKAARAGAEQLERDRTAFEKQKQTTEWAATAELKQELTNVKAANAALVKEKAAAEVIAVKAQQAEAGAVKALEEAKEAGARVAKAVEEAKERESRSSKALEEANTERTRLDKVIASLQAEIQTLEVAVTGLTARMTAAEERANVAVEARDALTSSFQQLEADREWMRSQGIPYIVQAIMDAPETATGLDLVK
ncbi:hypothetical protein HanHA300_Chr10g0354791 [Helianthus annuus]|nr:hypothetical protein HanHA300_Chr10g0354791 [Helianthus annuus]KAJ0529323.1 hypothetical protein HanHA89_Chr10g0376481 [Helianthus annuus]KAJ0696208.1 hypothetical protein HanLR1_Chr10g0354371 [Helianthus annuus]